MAQCVKALATKSDSLSSTPGTQVKEENCSLSTHRLWHMCIHIYICTHNVIKLGGHGGACFSALRSQKQVNLCESGASLIYHNKSQIDLTVQETH